MGLDRARLETIFRINSVSIYLEWQNTFPKPKIIKVSTLFLGLLDEQKTRNANKQAC